MEKSNPRKLYIKVFFSAFIMFLIGILPILIITKGKYLFYGDYNVQMVPFFNYIAKMFKEGIPAYDWNTDAGMNFISAYSFYGLASPYTFLSLLFPLKALPYALTFINALKFGVAALTSCMYCSKFVKKDNSAYICGLLYAFSGIQFYNMVFHFADIISLFPLLLITFDNLVLKKQSFGFAIMLGIMGLTNYYFLWGECVFLLIYFIINIVMKRFRMNVKLFCKIAFETLLGIGLSMIILLPSFMSLRGNSRASTLIFDSNLLAYDTTGTIQRIIQSMFMLPETLCAGVFFSGYQLDVSSVSLFIPLFSIVGVSFAIRNNKKSWYSVLLYVCAVFAAIPLLNSLFSALNASYYARWFYMPMLIMIMMTGKYIDEIETAEIKNELKIILVVLGIFTVYTFILLAKGTLGDYAYYVAFILIFSAFCALILFVCRYKPSGKITFKNLNKFVCVLCVCPFFTMSMIINFLYDDGSYTLNFYKSNFNDGVSLKIDDDEFFRTSSSENSTFNVNLYYDYPTIDAFNSTINGGICDFWESAGRYRRQNNTLDRNDYAACSLLSVKYELYYNKPNPGDVEIPPEYVTYCRKGFKQYKTLNHYIIFENEHYIPMGFTYDYYLNENQFPTTVNVNTGNKNLKDEDAYKFERELPDVKKYQKLMLKAMVLNDEQIEEYKDILKPLPEALEKDVSDEAYYNDCDNRKATAAYEFKPDGNGFTSKIKLERDNLVFYSVPYDEGFTAYVDGKETKIEKVFGGLSAVKVPEGDHTIRFDYTVSGLKGGKIITFTSLGIFAVYVVVILISKYRKNKNK